MSRATRAESLTGSTRKIEYASDFLTSFAKTPVGNQLAKITNDKSITQSLKNLIMTNLGERLYQPYIGSNVMRSLFENNTTENLETLQFYIENVIDNNEKRVSLIDVQVVSGLSENDIKITIIYNTINNSEPVTFEYILKRVR